MPQVQGPLRPSPSATISIIRRAPAIPARPVTRRSSHSMFISRSGAGVKSALVMATPDRRTERLPSRWAIQRSSANFHAEMAWSKVVFPALFGPARTTESPRSKDCSRKLLKFRTVTLRSIGLAVLAGAERREAWHPGDASPRLAGRESRVAPAVRQAGGSSPSADRCWRSASRTGDRPATATQAAS